MREQAQDSIGNRLISSLDLPAAQSWFSIEAASERTFLGNSFSKQPKPVSLPKQETQAFDVTDHRTALRMLESFDEEAKMQQSF